jgi:molybdate transport system ATP-binding protein
VLEGANLLVRIAKRVSPDFTLEAELSAPPGITILFGRSGAGKTTVLDCIAGLARPGAGRIAVGGRALFDSGARIDLPVWERSVGYLFQDLALFPHMTVEENVLYGLAGMAPRLKRDRMTAILDSFRIGALRSRKPSEISGGERQRVALARSLVTDPRVLLLDEPLSALDAITKSAIVADLRSWNVSHGIPIVYVTHSPQEAFALGEHVVILEDGKVMAQGTPQQVLKAPFQETVAQLAGFENIFSTKVIALSPEQGTMLCRLAGSEVTLEVPLTQVEPGESINVAIRAGDIMVATARPQGLSARNTFVGRLVSLRREGVTAILGVDCGVGFEVHLTPAACEQLQLAAGRSVWLVIKTYSCHMVAPQDTKMV